MRKNKIMIPYIIAGAIGFVVAKLFEEDETPKYADGGSVLLAPNGNPSYLTPEQYKLVRTPAFKQWFGDWEKAYETGNYDNVSKVIAYNMKGFSGEPLVCSHSSYNKFNEFNTPSFFQEGAGGGAYGDESDEEYVNYDVFLNIKNPLELRGAFLKGEFIPLISKIYKNAGISQEEYERRIDFAEKYLDGYGLFKLFEKPYSEYGYYWNWIFDYCKKNGYDGFVMRDSDQSMQNYITTWVAFNPEQIKLADGTNTTFDGSNPDIRFDKGGEIDEVDGEYYSLDDFIQSNPSFSKILAELYNIDENEVEDNLQGELGYDEEVLKKILGKDYRVFYNEDSDVFEIKKRSIKKNKSAIIVLANENNKKEISDIILSEIFTQYEPRFGVLVDGEIVGASTFLIKGNKYYFDVVVTNKSRGLGISKLLIEEIIKDARELNVKSLEAEVVNPYLLSYLESIGFSTYKNQDQNFAILDLTNTNKKF